MAAAKTVKPDPERDAQEILNTVWLRGQWEIRIPVDPFAIARDLGMLVFISSLDDGVSGMLVKQPGYDDPEIYLNERDHRNRQRFTCAHEIGHYVKRSAEGNDGSLWQYVDRRDDLASQGKDPDEIYANQFAASLLMPGVLVLPMRAKGRSVAALAYEFGVSADAMNYRLDNLDRK
jgi:Zn-dependent peptidase ImmA (M78 family)